MNVAAIVLAVMGGLTIGVALTGGRRPLWLPLATTILAVGLAAHQAVTGAVWAAMAAEAVAITEGRVVAASIRRLWRETSVGQDGVVPGPPRATHHGGL